MSQDIVALCRRAIIEGVSERCDAELSESKESVACSQAHLQKMSEILGFDVQKTQKVRKCKIIATVAILAAALVIGSLTLYAYRAQIREFFVHVFEEYIALEAFGEQPPSTLEKYYEVNYVPAGYTLTKDRCSHTGVYYEWKNDEGQFISFDQRPLNVGFCYDSEQSDVIAIDHNGIVIYCMQYESIASYTWNDGTYVMNIHDYTGLAIEEILKMIESIS